MPPPGSARAWNCIFTIAPAAPLSIAPVGNVSFVANAEYLPGLRTGWFTNANDHADSCATGSGGGDPSHGTAPGSPDPVSGVPRDAEASGGASFGCRGHSGGGGSGGMGWPCCPPDDDSGSGNSSGPGPNNQARTAYGAGLPVWEVSEPYINLWLYDEPLGYQPGIGPRVSFKLAYKQRGTDDVSTNIFNFANKWTCSWLSYVEDDGSGTNAIVNTKLGGQTVFSNESLQGLPCDRRTQTLGVAKLLASRPIHRWLNTGQLGEQ